MTRRLLCSLACAGAAILGNAPVPSQDVEAKDAAAAPEPASYFRDVRPILQAHCAGCHQPAKRKGDLVLTGFASLMAGIDGEDPVVEPGEPDDSLLIEVVTAPEGEAPTMPEDGDPLSAAQVEVLRRWIAEGAHDDSPASEKSAVDADHPPVYPRPPVVTSLDYSPDGELLAVSGYHEVLLHRSDGSGLVARLVGLAERIESVAFSPDGRSLAVVGGSPARMGEVQIWDVKTRELELSRTLTYDCLFGASWSHDSKLLAFGATDTAVRAIDAATGEQVLFQGAHDDWVLDTVFSTDASHLVTVSRDRSMKLIDVPHEQFIDNITSITPGALKGGLMAVARHPTRDELLIGGADGVPKIYRMYREKKRVIGDDYNLIRAFDRLPGRVFAVAYSPDGRRIAAGSSHRAGGEVRLFSTEDGALVWSHALRAGVFTLAFRPDGWAIAAGGFDGVVELIDAETGWLTRQFVPVPIETRQE